MKSLIVFCLMALCVPAFAQSKTFVMPEGTSSMQLIEGHLASVRFNKAACGGTSHPCEDFTTATLAFTLNGCADSLGPVTVQKAYAADGKLDLYVTAFNIVNPQSAGRKCYTTPIKSLDVILGGGFISEQQVRVHFASSFKSGK